MTHATAWSGNITDGTAAQPICPSALNKEHPGVVEAKEAAIEGIEFAQSETVANKKFSAVGQNYLICIIEAICLWYEQAIKY